MNRMQKVASITVRTYEQIQDELEKQVTTELRALAECYYSSHREAVESWTHGEIEKIWLDENSTLCIQYKDGAWWHYKNREWW